MREQEWLFLVLRLQNILGMETEKGKEKISFSSLTIYLDLLKLVLRFPPLGRMPSAVDTNYLGYRDGSYAGTNYIYKKWVDYICSGAYVPADDLTDPAPANTFAHLDATTVLSRKLLS